MTTTTNMGLTQSTVGTTTGPDWATNAENNLLTLDAHDHTSGKGVQLTPSSLNINADLEFNLNSATELKNVVLDNAVHASASGDTNNSVYEYDGNLYWRNASGGSVQITSGTAVNTSGGSISGMTGNAQVLFSSNSYAFKFDSSLSDPGIAKISHADIDLYKYDAAGSASKVTLKFLGTGTSAALTVPDETGTLLTTATSFAGTINVATSSSNAPINLKPNGTGHVAVGNGGASGKLTSNGAYDLVLDTNSGTNSGNITITDAADGNISLAPNGTGEIVIGSGTASGKITSSGAHDLVLDTNAGTNSGSITITDGSDGNIAITPNGTGEVDISKVDIDGGAIDGVTIGTNSVVTDLRVDNLKLDGNTISSTNTDGDIDISPNGTGSIDLNSGTLDLSAQTVDVTLNGAVDALNFDSNTLSIDASNNRVGIGDDSPASLLGLKGSSASATLGTAPGINLYNSGTTGGGHGSHIWFSHEKTAGKENSAAIYGLRGAGETDGDLQFAVRDNGSWVTAMHIDGADGGNVGIGTTSPASGYKLNVVNNGATGIRIDDTSDNSRVLSQLDNETFTTSFTKDGSGFNTTFKFKTQNSAGAVVDHLWLENGGDVNVKTGNLVIGTAGNGIDFSINGGNAETLDAYEEGTFTLSIVNYSGGTAPTIAGQNNGSYLNKYVKIGKTIICSMYLSIDFNSNTEVVFSGLPEIADGGGPVTVVHDSSMSHFQLGFGAVLHGTDDFNYFRDSNGTSTGSARIYNIGLTYVTT